MTRTNKRDDLILELLLRKGEVSFTDFENAGIMAKSTLNDHLHELIDEKAVRKAIGKTPQHLDRPVYLITKKGRTQLKKQYGLGRAGKLKDYF